MKKLMTGLRRALARDTPAFTGASESAPVDWPARFRAAAKAADRAGWIGIGADLQDLAFRIEVRHMPPHVVEAIGRALLGQAE